MSSFADLTPVPDGGSRGKYLNIWCDMLAAHNEELGRLRVGLFGAYDHRLSMSGMYIWDVKLEMFAANSAPPPRTAFEEPDKPFVQGSISFQTSALQGPYAVPSKEYVSKFKRFVAEANGYYSLTHAHPILSWMAACNHHGNTLP